MAQDRWSQRVGEHEIYDVLGSINDVVAQLGTMCDSAEMSELRRVKTVVALTRSRVSGRNVETVPPSQLPGIRDRLREIETQLRGAVDRGERGEALSLASVNDSAADQLLNLVGQLPAALTHSQEVGDALQEVKEDSTALFGNVEARLADLVRSLEEKDRELTERATAVSDALSANQRDGEAALTALRSDIDTSLQQAKAEFDSAAKQSLGVLGETQAQMKSLMSTQETNFSQQLTEQREALAEALEGARQKADEWTRQSQESEDRRAADRQASAESVLTRMESLKAQTEKLVGVIGESGLVAGYQTHANAEAKESNRWRIATVIIGALAVAVLAWAVYEGRSDSSWLGLVAKSGVSVALGALATYTGRLAARAHKRASSYRNRELALAALGPYLEALPDEKKQELYQRLATEFFTNLDDDSVSASAEWPSQASALTAAIQELSARMPAR